MIDRTIDPTYLAYQYGDSEKLRIRMEAHERYSERSDTARSGFERFTLDELPLVQSVFPNVERQVWPNAFVFPTAKAVLRFYASGRIDSVEERREDGGHRPPLLARMAELLDEIVAREGAIRIPKDSGCFLATVEA